MTKHSLAQLEMLLMRCRAEGGYRAVVIVPSRMSGIDILLHMVNEKMLSEDEMITYSKGVLSFPNGSVLRVSVTK